MTWLLSIAFASSYPCGSLAQAQYLAAKGELFPFQRLCLDVVADEPGEHRLTASQLLLQDAAKRGSHASWQRLAERHLAEIDPEDPALVLAYARFLFVSDRDEGSIAFINEVLPKVSGWGAEGIEPALALHRMRTVSAVNRWRATGSGQDVAHAYAAEWSHAVGAAGYSDGTAVGMCVMTGASQDC